MKNQNVLLRENVPALGRIGEVVRVRTGYARNYLMPRKLAVEATPENVRLMERRRVRVEAEEKQREADITARIEALGKITLSVVEKADATGTLYGSVGPATIVKLLARAGVELDEKAIRLEEPIKSVGTHEIPIHVWGEHYAGIQIVVEAEAG
jgi:large subunit ribosomal protein L9